MAKPGYRLALFATALALLVVLLGAYTRLTHAGLGCPDWPGCYGFIGVPQSAEQLSHAERTVITGFFTKQQEVKACTETCMAR